MARTQVLNSSKATVTVDFDAGGDAIGIELIGVEEFTLARLLEICGIELQTENRDVLGKTRYIRTGASSNASR